MLRYSFLLTILISNCLCQYREQSDYNQQEPRRQFIYDEDNYRGEGNPKYHPQILSHKQSLNHDGNFKYAFSSENGLLQGESIAPDGSRTGAYAYVDPTGRKISVKYVAGKEGFRILEGDHIPKAHPLLAAASQEPHPGYGGGGGGGYPAPAVRRPVYDDYNQYEGQINKPLFTQFRPGNPIDGGILNKPGLNRPIPVERSNEILPFPVESRYKGSLENREPEYNDEPGKANSFGSGYSFAFGG